MIAQSVDFGDNFTLAPPQNLCQIKTVHLYQVMQGYIKSKQKHNKNEGSGACPWYDSEMRNKITEKWVFGGLPPPNMRNKITETGTAKV